MNSTPTQDDSDIGTFIAYTIIIMTIYLEALFLVPEKLIL